MRNQIRKLILETIGDAKEEYKLFGSKLVNGLRKDPRLNSVIKKGYGAMEFEVYMENKYNMKMLGGGHFRIVFETENKDLIIKFATNGTAPASKPGKVITAVDANLQEVDRFNKYPRFFHKLYASSPAGHWVLVDKIEIIKTKNRFLDELLKFFTSTGNIDSNIKDGIIVYAYQAYQQISQYVSSEELASFDFMQFANDINNKIIIDFSGTGGQNPAFYPTRKKDIFFDIIRRGIEGGESYEEAVKKEVEPDVKHMFDEIKIHWIGSYLRKSTEKDPDYGYFKFANSIIDNKMLPLVKQYVVEKYLSDRNSREFFLMMQREKISLFDIREENTGLDENGQFKIIDATTF